MKYNKIFIVVVFFMAMVSVVFGQKTTFQLKEKNTREPIVAASYIYGKTSGMSNENGEITLELVKGETLYLSHISFGKKSFSELQLMESGNLKTLYFDEEKTNFLSPVLVYALKDRNPRSIIKLQNADWVQHDAGAVLMRIPGFDAIKKSGSFGFDPTFRGFKLDQLNIVNDGCMSATAACPNRMDPPTSQIPINQIQEIEIIKGPHSFRYGPSMGAVVNFKMLDPIFAGKNEPYGRITAGYESNGNIARTEGQLGFRTTNLQLSANGSYAKGDNYKVGNGTVVPAAFSRGTVGLIADISASEKNIFSVNINRNFARNTDFPALMMDLLTDDTWMGAAKYRNVPTNKWYKEWTTQVSAGVVDHLMGNILRNPTNMIAQTAAQTQTYNARTEFLIEENNIKAFIGADTKSEEISGDRTREMLMGPMKGKILTDYIWQDSRLQRYGVFMDAFYKFFNQTISLAFRTDYVMGEARKPAESFLKTYSGLENSDWNHSGSIGISSKWTDAFSTGIWLGRGVRSANISERFINFLAIGKDPYELVGNPELKPEKNNQLDMSINYKSSSATIQFSGYYARVSDFITSVIDPTLKPLLPAPGVRRFTNIEQAKLYGMELSWVQSWGGYFVQNLSWTYNNGQNLDEAMPLPEISPMAINALVEAKIVKGKFVPYIGFKYSFKQDRIATSFGEIATDGYDIFDFGFKSQPVNGLQVTMALNNAFNATYREHLSRFLAGTTNPLYSTGRSLIINVSYSF